MIVGSGYRNVRVAPAKKWGGGEIEEMFRQKVRACAEMDLWIGWVMVLVTTYDVPRSQSTAS